MPSESLESWTSYIETLNPKEWDLGLERIKPVYSKLINNPLAGKVVVIGGTNGKGSTVEYLSNLLQSQGKKVGTYTSPHLFCFNERIRINGKNCSDQEILNSFVEVEKSRKSIPLTYFEFSTLAALHLFSLSSLDVVILEVGLGGRLDAVNVVDSDISILTNVELDHQDWLGNNKETIGKEKADIFRTGKPAILAHKVFPQTVYKIASNKGAKVYALKNNFNFLIHKNNKWTYSFKSQEGEVKIKNIKLNNLSIESASAALTAFALLGYNLNKELKEVINKTQLEGRCQLLGNRFLIDVSHNPAAALNLKNFITRKFGSTREIIAILGVMSDKDITGMVKPLRNVINQWYITSPNTKRAMKVDTMASKVKEVITSKIIKTPNVKEAVAQAYQNFSQDSLIVVMGSFYTVSEAVPVIQSILKNK